MAKIERVKKRIVGTTPNKLLVTDINNLPTSSTLNDTDLVVGPASATNSNIALFDTASGKVIKDSGASISIDGTMIANSDAKIPTEKAIVTYITSQVLATPRLQGIFNASSGTYPTTRKDLTTAPKAGDYWLISVAGTLGGVAVQQGDFLYALVDTPGQTNTNWASVEKNFGFTPEDSANKTDNVSANSTSSTKFTSAKAVFDFVNAQKYKTSFTTTDFIAGVYTLSAITHGLGATNELIVNVIDADNNVVASDLVVIGIATNGNITVSVEIGFEFNGKIFIQKA